VREHCSPQPDRQVVVRFAGTRAATRLIAQGIQRRGAPGPGPAIRGEQGDLAMADIVFLAASIAFFAVSISYVWGCDKL
jgi:hypothetical protein